jgi:hypothetical protein
MARSEAHYFATDHAHPTALAKLVHHVDGMTQHAASHSANQGEWQSSAFCRQVAPRPETTPNF